MAIEFKPPLLEFKPVGIECNSAQVTFKSSHLSPDHVLGSDTRAALTQHEVDHALQSNRAIPVHSFQLQKREASRQNDTVYLDQLHSSIASDAPSSSALEGRVQGSEILQHHASVDDSHKTPNVYINGLPPHFPEDQLYALAAPFGEVKSVRTFTRHVRDSESGYGFVLYVNVAIAENVLT
jgi:hypothetical protein